MNIPKIENSTSRSRYSSKSEASYKHREIEQTLQFNYHQTGHTFTFNEFRENFKYFKKNRIEK